MNEKFESAMVALCFLVLVLALTGCTIMTNRHSTEVTKKAIDSCVQQGGLPYVESGGLAYGQEFKECRK